MGRPPRLPDDRAQLVESLFVERRAEALRLAWALTGDAAIAQELTQEAFVRVYLHRAQIRDPAAMPAYLRRTVVNLAFSHGRQVTRSRRWPEAGETSTESVGRPPPGGPDQAESHLDLLAALARLPERRRACVVLRYYLDLSEADTAASLGVSIGTVKSQTHKALAQMREHLDEPRATVEREELA